MDVIAHTLWTNALFHLKYQKLRKMRYLAAFFGVAPDLVGFTPLFFYLIFSGKTFAGERFSFENDQHWTFHFASEMYNYSHSLVIFAAVFIGVLLMGNIYFKVKNRGAYKFWVFWPLLGWALHILIDIPTHPDFYHTPFLYPISSYEVQHGVAWSHPVFMVINYTLMAMAYAAIFVYHSNKYGPKEIIDKKKNTDGPEEGGAAGR
ncbi:hypothetical protein IPM19_01520 [bacterium]|nr:MAG: hypothetical protein IPM19_01520 [bacterium]